MPWLLDQPEPQRLCDRTRAAGHIELNVDVAEVSVHRRGAEPEMLRDPGRRQVICRQLQHIPFARGERARHAYLELCRLQRAARAPLAPRGGVALSSGCVLRQPAKILALSVP